MSTQFRQDDSAQNFSPDRVLDRLDTALTRFAGEMSRPGSYEPALFNRPGFTDLPNLSIDFDPDPLNHSGRGDHRGAQAVERKPYVAEPHEGPSTSKELGAALLSRWDELDIGKKGGKLTSDEIYAYLGKHNGQLDTQTEKDLRSIADDMHRIGGKDGVISKIDLMKYMAKNQHNDGLIMMRREFEGRIRALEEENARLRDGGGKPTDQTRPNDNVYRGKNGVSDIDSPEQVAFRQKYGIPDNIDLTKFAIGKPNDGVVGMPAPNVGLMGPIDENDPSKGLKWDNPNYHSAKYDTCRNLAQVIGYMQNMPEETQKQFMQDFLKLQAPVIQAEGWTTGDVYKESIYINGVKKDTIQAFGAPGAPRYDQIQWIDA